MLRFGPDQFADEKTAPSRTTLGRAWCERFPEQLKTFIHTPAEHILGFVNELGNPLGLRDLEPENKSAVSSLTEQRYTNR